MECAQYSGKQQHCLYRGWDVSTARFQGAELPKHQFVDDYDRINDNKWNC